MTLRIVISRRELQVNCWKKNNAIHVLDVINICKIIKYRRNLAIFDSKLVFLSETNCNPSATKKRQKLKLSTKRKTEFDNTINAFLTVNFKVMIFTVISNCRLHFSVVTILITKVFVGNKRYTSANPNMLFSSLCSSMLNTHCYSVIYYVALSTIHFLATFICSHPSVIKMTRAAKKIWEVKNLIVQNE